MHIQLSLSLHFYVLYLLLNTCDGNCAFWRHSVLVNQSSSFSRKQRTLSLQICVRQTVQLTQKPSWLQNLATDAEKCVHCTRHMSTTPATWLTHGQAYHKTLWSCWSMEKAVVYVHEGKRTSLWTSAKLKLALFRANTIQPMLFRATNSLPRKTRCFVFFSLQLFKSK